MALPHLSAVGRLTADPELRFSASGIALASVSLAFNARRLNRQTQEWEDGDVFFVRGTAFRHLAENIVETLRKGMEVQVSGRLKTDQWEDQQTGAKRSATSLLIDSIGPNLAYATATVTRVSRDSAGAPRGDSSPADDPWGAAPPAGSAPADEEAPF